MRNKVGKQMSVVAHNEADAPVGAERDAIMSDIQALDSEVAEYREYGDYRMVLECLERGLALRKMIYSEGNQYIKNANQQLCEACNFVATSLLQTEDMKAAKDLLERALQVSEGNALDKAITFNNLACYYRRTNKLRTALTFLQKAISIEERISGADTSQTHLNLCATLSQLNRHDLALQHAQRAVVHMYEMLAPDMLSGALTAGQLKPGATLHERVSVLCIAYHNLAVEYEYVKDKHGAIRAYEQGMKMAEQFLTKEHQIHGILSQSHRDLTRVTMSGGNRPIPRSKSAKRIGQNAGPKWSSIPSKKADEVDPTPPTSSSKVQVEEPPQPAVQEPVVEQNVPQPASDPVSVVTKKEASNVSTVQEDEGQARASVNLTNATTAVQQAFNSATSGSEKHDPSSLVSSTSTEQQPNSTLNQVSDNVASLKLDEPKEDLNASAVSEVYSDDFHSIANTTIHKTPPAF